MQDHSVFEVAGQSEVASLAKVRSKWLHDMTGNALKVRFVAQHIAFGERDDVSVGTRHLQLLAHCWHWQPAQTCKKPSTSGLFDTAAAVVHSPIKRAHCAHSATWDRSQARDSC